MGGKQCTTPPLPSQENVSFTSLFKYNLYMETVKKVVIFFKKNPVLTLIIIYFAIRLPQLTLLPIFNDEAIYMDWGWRETHVPGFLYYSLYDAKQPFMMWLFGIFSNFFSNPLFASRLVSLLIGILSTTGIYFIGKELFNRKVGIVSALSYIVIPIFVLFDRQALLESAVIASNIWSFYFLNKALLEKRHIKYELLTGLSLALGFYSKSTAALFLTTTIAIFTFYFIKTRKQTYFLRLGSIIGVFACTILLLLINPQFWQTLPSNSRYVLTISELLKFPVLIWIQNAWGIAQIAFIFLTPLIFLFAFFTIIHSLYERKNVLLLIWIIIPLLIALLTLKGISQRYVVGVLPLFTILSSWGVIKVGTFLKKNRFTISIALLIIPLSLSLLLIYDPFDYFVLFSKITPYSESGFINGQTSGFGIQQSINFLENENKKEPIIVTYAENSGNPESAISVLMSKKGIMNGYFEMKYLAGMPPDAQCIETASGDSIFFVSRDDQVAGFEKYVIKVKTFDKPVGNGSIGVFRFISGCEKPTKVDPTFQGH
jgi:hypothetical protein